MLIKIIAAIALVWSILTLIIFSIDRKKNKREYGPKVMFVCFLGCISTLIIAIHSLFNIDILSVCLIGITGGFLTLSNCLLYIFTCILNLLNG